MDVFLDDSQGERQVFRCPDLPEAPKGSLFHPSFPAARLRAERNGARLEFWNRMDRAAYALLQRDGRAWMISVHIVEKEIRSFNVFKAIEFRGIARARLAGGFAVGFSLPEGDVACTCSPAEAQQLLSG